MSIKNSAELAERNQRRADLKKYKATITRGLRNFVETGTALGMIAKQRLYKEDGYASFEEFVEAEFDLSRSSAYRQVDAARVVQQLSQVETIQSKITNQAQALELAPLVKDMAAMISVVEAAEATGKLTATSIEAARKKLYPAARVIEGEWRDDAPRPAIESPSALEIAQSIPRCEQCRKLLAEGIVKAAQTRCVKCDPEREHFGLEVGGPCTTCASTDPSPWVDDSGDVGEGVSGRTAADSDALAAGAEGSAEGATPSPTAAPAGEPAPPVGSPVTPDPSTDESVSKSQLDATSVEVSSPSPAVLPDPAGQETGQDVPAPASPRNDLLVGGPGPDSPAGQPPASDTPEELEQPRSDMPEVPAVATGQPGQDPSPEEGVPSTPSFSPADIAEGSGSAGHGLEEGGIPLEPSSSPDLSDPESLVQHLEQFVAGLDHLDIDVLGPLMTEEQLARAHRAADNIAWAVGMLTTWSEKS